MRVVTVQKILDSNSWLSLGQEKIFFLFVSFLFSLLLGIPLNQSTGRNASDSSSYVSNRLFLTFSYNLALSAFEPQFLNYMELLNFCKQFIGLTSFLSVHLKSACEFYIFVFVITKTLMFNIHLFEKISPQELILETTILKMSRKTLNKSSHNRGLGRSR